MQYEAHDASLVFLPVEEEEFQRLVSDVRVRGLLEPIELYEGKILDGRARYSACVEAGIEPTFVEAEIPAGMVPVEYVIGKNLAGRKLTLPQRVAVALKAAPSLKRTAREVAEANLRTQWAGDHGPKPEPVGSTTQRLAKALDVGSTTIQKAMAVERREPEVTSWLAEGVNLTEAAQRAGYSGMGGVRERGDTSAVDTGERDSAGRRIPVYFGKGDRWSEAITPLQRYGRAWEKKEYKFGHLNAKEAKKRLQTIAELRAHLDAIEADLIPRTAPARMRAPSEKKRRREASKQAIETEG